MKKSLPQAVYQKLIENLEMAGRWDINGNGYFQTVFNLWAK
jgi:hypothetical protein